MSTSLSSLVDNLSEKLHSDKCKDCKSELDYMSVKDKDYTHAQKVFEEFKLKKLGNCHDFYVKSDTLLLKDVFETSRDKCIEIYELYSAHFLSAPGLTWLACLEKRKLELELLINIDLLLMIEKDIRGGICHAIHRYAKANDKYVKNYDRNIESLCLMYLYADSLY